jgi:hypothetical protein
MDSKCIRENGRRKRVHKLVMDYMYFRIHIRIYLHLLIIRFFIRTLKHHDYLRVLLAHLTKPNPRALIALLNGSSLRTINYISPYFD